MDRFRLAVQLFGFNLASEGRHLQLVVLSGSFALRPREALSFPDGAR